MSVNAPSTAQALVSLLGRIAGGRAEADVDGVPFAVLDGEKRNLTIQIAPLLEEPPTGRSVLHEGRLRLWEARGVPSALARAGWHVGFQDGPHEILRLGRDVSALTGHVHVSPAALWKLRRLA